MRRLRPLHVALLIPWMVAVVAARLPLRDNSYLWHVRAGAIQVDSGSVITTDPFSFTFAGQPWRTQSWLFELLYGWLDQAIGLTQYTWIVAICAVAFVIAVGLIIWRGSSSLVATVILLAGTSWIMAPFMNPRPVIASYVFFAVAYLIATHPRLRWALVPLTWVWASVHASYVLGILLVGAVRLCDGEIRKGVEDGSGMLAVSFFTAHGVGAVSFLVGFVENRAALSYLTEWSTPKFLSIAFAPAIGLLLMVILAAVNGRMQQRDLLLVLFGLVVLFSASRSVLLGWLVLLPFAAAGFGPRADARVLGGEGVGVGAVGVVLAVMLIVVPLVVPLDSGLEETRFPLEAADALDMDVPTFHDDVAGGYLAFASYPAFRVFADDRAELYGESFYKDLIEARSGTPGWRPLFEDYDIRQALLREGDGLVIALRESGWRTAYSDDEFVILVPGT